MKDEQCAMKNSRRSSFSDGGFTIIELMIATVIFSMILILITVGVIRFNDAYYRGITQSDTQNVARTVMSNIAQSIQFTDGTVTAGMSGTGGWQGLCVGGQFYQYLPGKQLTTNSTLGPNQTNKALIESSGPACSGSTPGSSLAGSELLSPHMRLSNLSVSSVGTDLFKIEVRVVYGDDDLVCASSVAGSCGNASDTSGATAPDAECKESVAGSQFCAEADLSTVVQKRID